MHEHCSDERSTGIVLGNSGKRQAESLELSCDAKGVIKRWTFRHIWVAEAVILERHVTDKLCTAEISVSSKIELQYLFARCGFIRGLAQTIKIVIGARDRGW